jgi:hypothetical protein
MICKKVGIERMDCSSSSQILNRNVSSTNNQQRGFLLQNRLSHLQSNDLKEGIDFRRMDCSSSSQIINRKVSTTNITREVSH